MEKTSSEEESVKGLVQAVSEAVASVASRGLCDKVHPFLSKSETADGRFSPLKRQNTPEEAVLASHRDSDQDAKSDAQSYLPLSPRGEPPDASVGVRDETDEELFAVRFLVWKGRRVRIAMQNRNGPCPLLAVLNALSLTGAVQIPLFNEQRNAPPAVGAAGQEAFSGVAGLAVCRTDWVSVAQIQEVLSDFLRKKLQSGGLSPDEQFAINEGLACLPAMSEGLCLNVRFHAIDGFEPSAALSLFDAFGLRVLHGWRPTREKDCFLENANCERSEQICSCAACFVEKHSYNQLAERAALYRHLVEEMSATEEGAFLLELVRDGELSEQQLADIVAQQQELTRGYQEAEVQKLFFTLGAPDIAETLLTSGPISSAFLESTSSQLSLQGLRELQEGRTSVSSLFKNETSQVLLPLEVPAVLFRNNHFSVVVRREDQDIDQQFQQLSVLPRTTPVQFKPAVFALCTDAAFLESAVVWERLEDVKGDNSFCGADFTPLLRQSSPFSSQMTHAAEVAARTDSRTSRDPPAQRNPPASLQAVNLIEGGKDVSRKSLSSLRF